MSQAEAPEAPPSFEIYTNVRDHYRNKLRISQQELLDRLETLRRRKVEELQQFVTPTKKKMIRRLVRKRALSTSTIAGRCG